MEQFIYSFLEICTSPHAVLLQPGWSQVGFQNSASNKSHRESVGKRHLHGPVAPRLQHVVWRLSNSNRSTLDYLESFERQPGQLWGCALRRWVLLHLPRVSIKPNVHSPASPAFHPLPSFLLAPSGASPSPSVEGGEFIFSLNYDESAKRYVSRHVFFFFFFFFLTK